MKTRSTHAVLASSISSLHALSMVSFMVFGSFLFCLCWLLFGFGVLIVCDIVILICDMWGLMDFLMLADG